MPTCATSGWPERATSCLMWLKGTKIPYAPPTASYTMEGTVWTLVPVEGKPTWIQSPDPAKTPGPEARLELLKSSLTPLMPRNLPRHRCNILFGRGDDGGCRPHGVQGEHARRGHGTDCGCRRQGGGRVDPRAEAEPQVSTRAELPGLPPRGG